MVRGTLEAKMNPYEARKLALEFAIKSFGEYEKDSQRIVEAAAAFERYLIEGAKPELAE